MTTDTLTAQLQEEARKRITANLLWRDSETKVLERHFDDIIEYVVTTAVQKAIKAYHAELEEKILQAYCTPEHHDTHVCGFNDGEQVCDCYNEALYMARKLSDSIINKE